MITKALLPIIMVKNVVFKFLERIPPILSHTSSIIMQMLTCSWSRQRSIRRMSTQNQQSEVEQINNNHRLVHRWPLHFSNSSSWPADVHRQPAHRTVLRGVQARTWPSGSMHTLLQTQMLEIQPIRLTSGHNTSVGIRSWMQLRNRRIFFFLNSLRFRLQDWFTDFRVYSWEFGPA